MNEFVGKANLILDLGNSETRAVIQYNVGGVTGNELLHLSNKFAEVSEDCINQLREDGYTEQDARLFNCNGELSTYIDFQNLAVSRINSTVVVGNVVSTMPTKVVRHSTKVEKFSNPTTAYSITYALIEAYRTIGEQLGIQDYSKLDISWRVIVLVPPKQAVRGKKPLTDLIKSLFHRIDVLYPVCTINPKLQEVTGTDGTVTSAVHILREGHTGFIGVVSENEHTARAEYENLLDSNSCTMVFDIGYGTTDVVIMKQTRPVGEGFETINIGGSAVDAAVSKAISEMTGRTLDINIVSKGIVEGKLMIGNQNINNLLDIIKSCRQSIANQIINSIKTMFENLSIDPNSITHILIIGGNAERTPAGIDSLGDYVADTCKKLLLPYAEILPLPKRDTKAVLVNGEAVTKEVPLSPRDFNIRGANFMASKHYRLD